MADAQIQVQVNVAGADQLKDLGNNVKDAGDNAKTAGSSFSELGKNITGIIASIGLFSNGLFTLSDAFDSVEKADLKVERANKTVREALQKRDEIQADLNKSTKEGLTIEKTATGQLVTTIDGHKKLVAQMQDGTLAIKESNGQWQRLVTVVKDAKGNLIATDGTFRSLVTTLKDGSKVYTDAAGNLQVLDDGQKKSKFTAQDLKDANTDLNTAYDRQALAVKQDEKAHAELIPRLVSGASQMIGGAAAAAQLGKDLVGMGGKAKSAGADLDTHNKSLATTLGTIGKIAIPLAAVAAAYLLLKNNVGGSRDALEQFGVQLGKAVPALQPLLKVIGDIGRGILGLGFGNLNKDLKALQDQLAPIFNTIKQKFGEMSDAFQKFVQQIIRGDLSGAFKTLVDSATKFSTDIVNAIKSVNWSQVWQGLKDAWTSTLQWFASAGTNLVNAVSNAIKTADWAAIGKAIADDIVKAMQFQDELIRIALSRFTAAWKSAAENYDWKATTDVIVNHMKSSLDSNIEGFTNLGKSILNGLQGVLTGKGGAAAATDWGPVGNAIIGGISDGTKQGDWSIVGSNILAAMQATFQTNIQGFAAIGTTIVNAIAGAVSAGSGQLQSAFAQWVAGIPGWLAGGATAVTTAVTQWVSNVASGLSAGMNQLATGFSQWVSGISGWLAGGATAITAAITQWVTNVASGLSQGVTQLATGFAQWVAGIPGWLAGGVNAVTTAVTQWVTGVVGALSAGVSQVVSGFAQWVSAIPGALAAGVTAVTTAVTQWVTGVSSSLSSGVSQVVAGFAQWVSSIPGALAGGVTAVTTAVQQWVTGVTGALSAGVAQVTAGFAQWVSSIPGALAGGVQAVTTAVQQWITGVPAAISAGVQQLVSGFQQWVSAIPGALAGGVQAVTSAVTQWVSGAPGAISQGVAQITNALRGWVSAIPGALQGGAQAVGQAVQQWVTGAAQAINQAGQNVGRQFWAGIQQGINAAGGALAGTVLGAGLGLPAPRAKGGTDIIDRQTASKVSSLHAAKGGSFIVSKPTRLGNLKVGEGSKPELLTLMPFPGDRGAILNVLPLTGPRAPKLHAQSGGTFGVGGTPSFGTSPTGLFGFTAGAPAAEPGAVIDYGAGIPAPVPTAGQGGPQLYPPSTEGAGTILVQGQGGVPVTQLGQYGTPGNPVTGGIGGLIPGAPSTGGFGGLPETGLPIEYGGGAAAQPQQAAAPTGGLESISPYQMASLAGASAAKEVSKSSGIADSADVTHLIGLIKSLLRAIMTKSNDTNLLVDGQKMASSVQKYIGSNAYGGM